MSWLGTFRRIGAAMVGAGDYAAYCAHMRDHHPDRAVMSERAFFRDRQQARYGSKGGGKCC